MKNILFDIVTLVVVFAISIACIVIGAGILDAATSLACLPAWLGWVNLVVGLLVYFITIPVAIDWSAEDIA